MMKQTVLLLGAKSSKGTLENGKSYDTTKLYVQTALKDGLGFSSVEYTWGDSTNFDKLKGLTFPCQVDLSMDIITNGRTTSIVVTDIKPITAQKATG